MPKAKTSPISKFVIVGAGSQTGQALAEYILEANDNNSILLTSRADYQFCEQLAQTQPERVTYISRLDLTQNNHLGQFRDEADKFTKGERYGVFMPSGYFPGAHKPFIDTSNEERAEVYKSNVLVPSSVMCTLIPSMLKGKGGHFIGFSCQSTKRNDPWMADFTAAKTALASLMRTLANEHGSHGLQFNGLAVSSLNTQATRHMKPHGDLDHYLDPADLAELAYGLVTNDNSRFSNGMTEDAYLHSPTDHSFYGWAKRIETDENRVYLREFTQWTPVKGKPFPFNLSPFKPSPP